MVALLAATAGSASAAVPGHGRAWELVTPQLAHGAQLLVVRGWSADGDRVIYVTRGPLPGAQSGELFSHSVGRREAGGWGYEPVSVPLTVNESQLLGTLALGVSADLSTWAWSSVAPLFGGRALGAALGHLPACPRRGPDAARRHAGSAHQHHLRRRLRRHRAPRLQYERSAPARRHRTGCRTGRLRIRRDQPALDRGERRRRTALGLRRGPGRRFGPADHRKRDLAQRLEGLRHQPRPGDDAMRPERRLPARRRAHHDGRLDFTLHAGGLRPRRQRDLRRRDRRRLGRVPEHRRAASPTTTATAASTSTATKSAAATSRGSRPGRRGSTPTLPSRSGCPTTATALISSPAGRSSRARESQERRTSTSGKAARSASSACWKERAWKARKSAPTAAPCCSRPARGCCRATATNSSTSTATTPLTARSRRSRSAATARATAPSTPSPRCLRSLRRAARQRAHPGWGTGFTSRPPRGWSPRTSTA